MKRNHLLRTVSGLGLGAAVLLGAKNVRAEPPIVVPPRVGPPAVRENVRENREVVRENRRERRPFRDYGFTWGRLTDRGLAVANLVNDSIAYRAGLRSDDVIVSINGHRVEAQADFDRYAYAETPDGRAKVIVFRDGREQILYLEPSALYLDAAPAPAPADDYGYFGVTLDERYPDRIVVRRVLPNSPAFVAGVRDGDEITGWHGERIKSAQDFQRGLHEMKPGTMDFEYSRDSKVNRAEAKFGPREGARPGVKVEVGR